MGERKKRLDMRQPPAAKNVDSDPQPLEFLTNTKDVRIVPAPNKGYISTPEKSFSTLSNDALADLYSNCIKLSTENKITQKNSWQLNLIDYMEDVLEQEATGDYPNFQAASCALDASVKIYSYRVDSVHTDTYKVLGGLTRTEREAAKQDAIEEELDGTEDLQDATTAEPPSKRRPRKVHLASAVTLETNPEALAAKHVSVQFLVDPLFRKTSAAFDQGGAKGLLLNHLAVQDGCALVFDSADAIDSNDTAFTQDKVIDVGDLLELFQAGDDLCDIDELDICPTFSSFRFDEVVAEGAGTDEEEDNENFLEEHIFDGEPHSAYLRMDESSNYVDTDNDQSRMSSDNDHSRADYDFFNPDLAQKWSGPAFWQYATQIKKEPISKKTKREKKPKKEFFIDFLASPPPESRFAIVGERSITLPSWEKTAESLTTLPNEPPFDVSSLVKLFIKPSYIFPTTSSPEPDDDSLQESMEIGNEENHQATGDTLRNDDESVGEPTGNDSMYVMDHEEGDGRKTPEEGMIQQPTRVSPININYTKIAKKVDVKELKKVLWDELCANGEFEGVRKFESLLQDIRHRGEIHEDLSVAMCFICTLHLCNEKGLYLEQQGIGDLLVRNKVPR